ncbi:MAG: M20/M25/M40 family metallo-hydrolase [Frankiales bacterium]|nr:M20/M25/M40 family metallo-hydrolase [Frankiales bacterium]
MDGTDDEVVSILSDLIRIDTTSTHRPERPAAELVATLLDEVGIGSRIYEGERGRANLVARIPGADASRPALLVHGHLDVVPAEAAEWSVHPFSGEVVDDCVWGRGAVDMKDMDAMVLAVLRGWAREGRRPSRDLVVAFLADEEMGSVAGARWLTAEHPDLFRDCTEAIGEVGGFSVSLDDEARLYLLQTAEKGLAWMRLKATGRPGHGAMEHHDNAVVRLASAVTAMGTHRFPTHVRPEVRRLLDELEPMVGRRLDPDLAEEWLPELGALARIVGASLRNSANPTRLEAGYQNNVVPSTASAVIDARFLPGQEDELMTDLRQLVGESLDLEVLTHGVAVETEFSGATVDAMCEAIRAEDPEGIPVPYMLTGGTDAKVFAPLGIRCFGFAPLKLPPELDFPSLFHGIDERVPVESLRFGVRVLDRFLSRC